jgi:hypothetical protein
VETSQDVLKAVGALVQRERERISDITFRLNQNTDGGATRVYARTEVDQMVRGFITMLLEQLEGRGDDTRALIVETLITGFIQSGDPIYKVVQWNATYMTLLAAELIPLLPEDVRAEGASWFAHFSGIYIADVVQAAVTADEQRRATTAQP